MSDVECVNTTSMIDRKTWNEFRDVGLLWFANRLLHLAGWAICVQVEEDGEVTDVYPARVKFRGFCEESETKGFVKLTQFLKDNVDKLLEEAKS